MRLADAERARRLLFLVREDDVEAPLEDEDEDDEDEDLLLGRRLYVAFPLLLRELGGGDLLLLPDLRPADGEEEEEEKEEEDLLLSR